jgi:hypothetical protein
MRAPFAALLLALAAFAQQPAAAPEHSSFLRRVASEAKARGETKVVWTAIPLPTGISNLDQILAHYSVVVAELVEARNSEFGDQITTWYRFRVDEVLHEQPEIDDDNLPPGVPAGLQAPGKDEILIASHSGTVVIDGVTIIQNSLHDIAFQLSHKYLLFVLLTSGGKLGQLAAMDASVYSINPDGTFESLTKRPNRLVADVQAFAGNIFSQFREAIRNRRP